MRILIISDIHANITALETVLNAADDISGVWCLGDLVGYGPDPNECVERIRSLDNLTCVLGNHDLAVLQAIESNSFHPEARTTIQWTRSVLTEDNNTFLRGLPEKKVTNDATLCHGSPRHPIWEYLLDPITALSNFYYFDTAYCFVGHTHSPAIYIQQKAEDDAALLIPEPFEPINMTPRLIINPGSVGQPRDRDPRASFAIYDLEAHTLENRRCAYDFRAVQQRMQSAGLPERHISRLEAGM